MAETTLYRQGQWPQGFLTPAQVIWRPLPASFGSGGTSSEPIRQLWIRFHPSTHASVFSTLRSAIPLVLSQSMVQGEEVKVELNDVRESNCVFELTGPKSGKVLKGALGELVKDEAREEVKTVGPSLSSSDVAKQLSDLFASSQIWKELPNIAGPGSVPRGMVIGVKTYDPRLQCVSSLDFALVSWLTLSSLLSFPPQNPKLSAQTRENGTPVFSHQPSATLAESDLWNPSARSLLAKKKFKKVELDLRRAKVSMCAFADQL